MTAPDDLLEDLAGALADLPAASPRPPDPFDAGLAMVRAQLDHARAAEARAPGDDAAAFALALPALDALERALAAADPPRQERVRELLSRAFRALGRRAILPESPLGALFDPHAHEAVATRTGDAASEGRVVEVIERGWRLGARRLRASRVVVGAARPPTARG
jgi:hypothetical protein